MNCKMKVFFLSRPKKKKFFFKLFFNSKSTLQFKKKNINSQHEQISKETFKFLIFFFFPIYLFSKGCEVELVDKQQKPEEIVIDKNRNVRVTSSGQTYTERLVEYSLLSHSFSTVVQQPNSRTVSFKLAKAGENRTNVDIIVSGIGSDQTKAVDDLHKSYLTNLRQIFSPAPTPSNNNNNNNNGGGSNGTPVNKVASVVSSFTQQTNAPSSPVKAPVQSGVARTVSVPSISAKISQIQQATLANASVPAPAPSSSNPVTRVPSSSNSPANKVTQSQSQPSTQVNISKAASVPVPLTQSASTTNLTSRPSTSNLTTSPSSEIITLPKKEVPQEKPSTILVLSAGSLVGGATLTRLAKLKVQSKVIAGVRDHSKKLPLAVRKAKFSSATMDYSQPETLVKAFEGVKRLFLVVPNVQERVTFAKTAIDAAKKSSVEFILVLSVPSVKCMIEKKRV